MQLFAELFASGMIAGAKIGIAALGFALIFYATREMHFAFGALSVAGGYICYWVVAALSTGPVGTVLGIIAAMVFIMAVSVALHHYMYLRLGSVVSVVMASLGISLLVENIVQILAGPDVILVTYPHINDIVQVGFLRMRLQELVVFILFVVIAVALDLFMNRTKLGYGMAATIEDSDMAELVGIRTARMRMGAYCAGAALGVLSGLIMLVDTGVRPANGFILLLFALIITILGRGSLRAVAFWSLLFGVIRNLWSWQFSAAYRELAVFALMIAYLVGRDLWERYQRDRIRPITPTTRTQET